MTTVYSDQKYINAFITEDTGLLVEIYKTHSERITWMILQNSGSVDEAADIFQDAMESILRQARRGYELKYPFKLFLNAVCWHKWLNMLKKKKKSRTVTHGEIDGYSGKEDYFKIAEDFILEDDRIKLIEEKFLELDEDCKSLLKPTDILMSDFTSNPERSSGAVRTAKSRCKDKWMKLVTQAAGFELLQW